MSDNSALAARLAVLARRAGAAILDVQQSGVEVTRKDDDSPVTQADRRAEEIITAGLAECAPSIPVVAEEAASDGRIPDIGDEFFLVDPLDGTKEFIRADGNGEFTVNIALVRDGVPVLGVVYAPALGRLFVGEGPGAAWTARPPEDAEAPLGDIAPLGVVAPDGAGVIAVASRSHRTPETDAYLDLYPIASLCSAGSSLKFCLVAAGEAHLYPRLGRTMEWDTAAGDAVLRAAGGAVLNLDGTPFRYGKRNQADDADFANPGFVALGDLAFIAPA